VAVAMEQKYKALESYQHDTTTLSVDKHDIDSGVS